MPKKSTDPFMAGLWEALIGDSLGPGGNQTGWDETPVRIRNRFIRAVRPVLQSSAAFQASAMELGTPRKSVPQTERKTRGKLHDPRELQLPLMTSMDPREKAGKKSGR